MEKNKTSIIFTGDIGFDKYMDKKWEDEELISPEIIEFFNSADHVAANIEGALISVDESESRGAFFHAMNPKAVSVFEKMNADIWSLGNNHTTDAGREGIESTLNIAKECGCKCFGAGLDIDGASAPLYINEAGGIGIIGVTYMNECVPATETECGIFRWDDMERICARIKEIKLKCRWCIVVSHGGEEFSSMPNPYTRDRYIEYLGMGADVVVGHHPHVPENYETFDDGKAIFYSLGNFIFDTDYQRVHRYTDTGVLLKLSFDSERMSFEAIGTRIDRNSERIYKDVLPDIFTNVHSDEYNQIVPLSAKAFIAENKRVMQYLKPDVFLSASEEVWNKYFFGDKTDGYAKGAHMDLSVIVPLAKQADSLQWQKSRLTKVKEYILKQL